jgi:hypothetical protein
MTTRRRAPILIAALCAAGLLAACGSDDASTDVETGSDDTTTTVDDTTTTEADMTDDDTTDDDTADGPASTGGSQFAVQDLAAHLDVETSEIDVVSAEAVTWSDSSVGCPQKGFMYQQVITEGTRIILEVDGTRYHYHSAGTGDPFRCATPQEPQSIG